MHTNRQNTATPKSHGGETQMYYKNFLIIYRHILSILGLYPAQCPSTERLKTT